MIIIIDSDPQALLKLEAISLHLDENIIIKKFLTYADAKDSIEKNPCEILILNSQVVSGKQSQELADLLISHQANAKLLIGVKDEAEKNLNILKKLSGNFQIFWFKKPISIIEVTSNFNVIRQNSNAGISPMSDYIPLKLELFKKFAIAPCDIFMQLSPVKMIKMCNKDSDFFTPEKFEGYKNRGLKKLFITEKDFNDLGEVFFGTTMVAKSSNISEEEYGLSVTESVMNFYTDLGINKEALEIINDNIASVTSEVKDINLKNLLGLFNAHKGDFIYSHSYLTSVFAEMICNKMTWGTLTLKKNIYLAAMMHDLELISEKYAVSLFEDNNKNDLKNLNKEEQSFLNSHPHRMADKLSKINEIPSDVLSLISKHHEGKGEDSYPSKIAAQNLAPINCLFNTAHQFSLLLLKNNFDISKIDEIILELRAIFPAPNFKIMIDALASGLKR